MSRDTDDFRHVESAFLKIQERSLFNLVPTAKVYDLLSDARIVHVLPRSKIPRDEIPDTIWIVIEGTVHLSLTERESEVVERVVSGRSIELRTLFRGENQWRFEWSTEETVELLAVPFADFRRALSDTPAVLNYLIKITCSPELHKIKNDLRFFGLEVGMIPNTLASLELEKAAKLDLQTASSRSVVVISRGNVTIEKNDVEKIFGSGDYFLWDPSKRGVSLEWSPDAEVWSMTVDQWQRQVAIDIEDVVGFLDPFAHGREQTRPIPAPVPPEAAIESYSGTPVSETVLSKPRPLATAFSRSYVNLFLQDYKLVASVVLAALVGTVLNLSVPFYTRYVFDQIGNAGGAFQLNWATFAVGIVTVLSGSIMWAYFIFFHHFRGLIEAKFAPLFMRHVFRMPLKFFAVRQVGDITSRLGDLASIRDAFIGSFSELIRLTFFVSVYVIALAAYSIQLAGVILVLGISLTIVVTLILRVLDRHRQSAREALGRSQSIVFEQFNSFANLKVLGAQVAARWRWEERRLEVLRAESDTNLWRAILIGISDFFGEIAVIAAIGIGGLLYLRGKLTVGELVAANALVIAIVEPITFMVESWGNLGQVALSIRRIDDVMSCDTEVENEHLDKLPLDLDGVIELKDVRFRYEADGPGILNGISLKVNPGETVAFVGKSGSGKSTLAYLLNRLLEPQSGSVQIGGREVNQLPLSLLRSQIALVIQENSVFSGTILENITGGEERPSVERAMRAAQMAGAHQFISRLGNGYSSRLGEGGSGLSAGQRQKVNIARALYRNPRILILDEATSALDGMSEEVIMENLKNPGVKRTTLIIAHRLNTVVNADRIFVIRLGKVVEAGTHEDLMALDGHYAELFRSQS